MIRLALVGFVMFISPGLDAFGAVPSADKVVTKLTATFEPADAKPGQTVTLKITIELIEGWSTYPLVQPDKGAKSFVNKLAFPTAGPIIFVDKAGDPANPKMKAEEALGIEKILYYAGTATWERKAVISPNAKAGESTANIKFTVTVCDKENCLPPKDFPLEAKIKIAGEAVKVEAKYADEVEKNLKK